MIKLVWRPVQGYEGQYEVSNTGLVRSVDRIVSDRKCPLRMFKGKTLKFFEHNGKQPYYCIKLCKNGKTKHHLVHRLVAEAFIPNPDNKVQVNHVDGNVHNNNVNNLEWVNNTENTTHAYKHQLRTRRVIYVEYEGVTYTFRALCLKLGISYKGALWRYHERGELPCQSNCTTSKRKY